MPAVDTFFGATPVTGPASHAFAITPDDGVDLPFITRFLLIGGDAAADVAVILAGNDEEAVTLSDLQPGVMHPLRVRRVLDTGTTATGIVGLY